MSRSVILADSDLEERGFGQLLLQRRGFDTLSCESLESLREQVSKADAPVVILDLEILGPDPIVELKSLREASSGSATIVMAVDTSVGEPSRETLVQEGGVSLVVGIPINWREVSAQLDELCERRSKKPKPAKSRLDEKMAALRAAYSKTLAAKHRSIVTSLDAYRKLGNATALTDAVMATHKIHGTAGSYGFPTLSDEYGRLEGELNREDRGGEDWWTHVDRALAACDSAQKAVLLPSVHKTTDTNTLETSVAPRLLLIDDDPKFCEFAQRVAGEALIEMLVAHSVTEAERIAENTPLAAAMVDIRLSGQDDAFELVRSLRRAERNKTLPIAFVTAHAELDNRLAAVNAGSSLFLEKPISEQRLKSSIRYLVSLRAGDAPPVLVIDDDDEFIDSVSIVLESAGLNVARESDPSAALAALERSRPQLVLLDLVMPGLSGFDVCGVILATPDWKSLPVLLMTARLGSDVRVATFEAGADDYLAKPIVPRELLARIRLRLEREAFIREHSRRDPVTGLLLRGAFVEEVNRRLAAVRREEGQLVVALLDLDRFKQVNDTHGHHAGDEVLARLGSLLLRRLRTEDIRARWGGDEFAIAMEGVTPQMAKEILSRVLTEFRDPARDGLGTYWGDVSFSAGVAAFPNDGETVEELLKAADTKLYSVKRAGRADVST